MNSSPTPHGAVTGEEAGKVLPKAKGQPQGQDAAETGSAQYALWNLTTQKWVIDADADSVTPVVWTANSYEEAAAEIPRMEQIAFLNPKNRGNRFQARLYAEPCPFCGSRDLKTRGEDSPYARIHCETCFADWRIQFARTRATHADGQGQVASHSAAKAEHSSPASLGGRPEVQEEKQNDLEDK